ncbi:MAG: DNA-directed RNA polymerase subunit beta, partial [bacterium]
MEELFKTPRLSFAKSKEVVDIPPLIAIQEDSYEWFLQKYVEPDKRRLQGLQQVFSETFPVTDFNNRVVLEFIGYILGETKYTEEECRDRDVTFGVPLKVKLRLVNRQSGEIREQEVFMRDMPLMTKRGTFIINGAERVIVSQLHRSPGILFSYDSQEKIYSCRLIPYRGAWVEFELDSNNVINVRLGRKRKMSATILLRAMGYSSTDDIIKLFHPDMKALPVDERLIEMRLAEPIKFGSAVFPIGLRITKAFVEQLQELGMSMVKALSSEASILLNTLEKDISTSTDDALLKLYTVLRPGEPPTNENAKQAFERLLFDPERYDLSEVGRYKINQKLNLDIPLNQWILTQEDIISSLKYLIKIVMKEGEIDDIDHLGNRRVRPVGELLQDQLRIGFSRLEKSIKERMTLQDVETMT